MNNMIISRSFKVVWLWRCLNNVCHGQVDFHKAGILYRMSDFTLESKFFVPQFCRVGQMAVLKPFCYLTLPPLCRRGRRRPPPGCPKMPFSRSDLRTYMVYSQWFSPECRIRIWCRKILGIWSWLNIPFQKSASISGFSRIRTPKRYFLKGFIRIQ